MKINISKLKLRNFLSFGQHGHEVVLDSHSTTLYLGENGSGKTSGLLDGLSYVLYGRAHRTILKSTIINSDNNKDCVVEVDFTIGPKTYKVVRGMKPNIFEIWVEGTKLDETATGDFQKHLEENILRMNFKAFCQIVVLGKANYTPFMRLPGPERRTIIEDLLDIQAFSAMAKLLRARITDLEGRMVHNKTQTELMGVKIMASDQIIKEAGASNDTIIAEHRKTIDELKSLILVHGAEITNTDIEYTKDIEAAQVAIEVQKQKVAVEGATHAGHLRTVEAIGVSVTAKKAQLGIKDSIMAKIVEYRDLKSKIEANHALVCKNSAFFVDNTTCPVCTQAITEETRQTKLSEAETQKAEFVTGIAGLVGFIEKRTKQLEDLKVIEDELNALNIQKSEAMQKVTFSQTTKSRLETDLRRLEAELAQLRINLEQAKIRIQTDINRKTENINRLEGAIVQLSAPRGSIADEVTKLEQFKALKEGLITEREKQLVDKQYYDLATPLLKDTGIKTRVVAKYLPVLNTTLNKYLNDLDFFVKFVIDENFEEKILSRFRDEFRYNNFSEGQKQRIDLALLFTFRDIAKMRNGVSTNLLVFDETLDSSMDAAGVADFLKIIKTYEDLNIFIVSHRSEELIEHTDRAFRFKLKNNFTQVEEVS